MSIDYNKKRGFICDMDGVLYHGNKVLPGAVEFVHWLQNEGKEYLFLTNNSNHTPETLYEKLKKMGLEVPIERFYTSAHATADFLRKHAPVCTVYALGEEGLLEALNNAGIRITDENPDYVVVGEGHEYSIESLSKVFNLVLSGAKLIGTNQDVSANVEKGYILACGALISPIEVATGKKAYFCGKPNPLMIRTGLSMLGCHTEDAVIIGDRMDTDILAGTESGVDTVLVLTGVTDIDAIKEYAYQPVDIFPSVGDIAKHAKENKF